jgi:hypothetical protein
MERNRDGNKRGLRMGSQILEQLRKGIRDENQRVEFRRIPNEIRVGFEEGKFGMEFEKGFSKKGRDFSFYDFMDLDSGVLREMWKGFMRYSNGIRRNCPRSVHSDTKP